MLQLFFVAFTMGALGSFHCVGMCGPLALSLPLENDDFVSKFSGALIYNVGRIVTYSFFGLIFGLIGKSFALFGFQQWLSIAVGVLIIILVIVPKKYFNSSVHFSFVSNFFNWLRSSLAKLFSKKNQSSLFAIGLLNGFLPCGFVYMAIAGALALGSTGKSIYFMMSFGLGTLPMMWSIAFFGNYISLGFRQGIRKVYPYLLVLIACLLILRGMGLDIPYLSPKVTAEKKEIQSCYANP